MFFVFRDSYLLCIYVMNILYTFHLFRMAMLHTQLWDSNILRAVSPTSALTNELYLSYVPPTYEYGTRPFLRWVLSQGRSPTREAVPKMPRTPSAFPFSGRLRRRAINPTPPKRVKAWGDGPLRPEVMYPVVEHTRTDCAARNHSRSRVPHHRTQSSIV